MRLITRRGGGGGAAAAGGGGGGFLAGEEGRHGSRKWQHGHLTKGYQSGNGLRSARLVAGWEPL